MTELVKSRYLIETTDIQVTAKPGGGKTTSLSDLNLRVKDCYTQMPIGGVVLEGGKEYKAVCFFATVNDHFELTPPPGGWGPRFDLAADAVWKKYSQSLPRRERARRWMWRWMGVGWFLFGTVWGVLMGLVGQILIGSNA